MAAPRKRKGKLSLSSSANLWAYRTLFGVLARIKPPARREIALGPKTKVLVFMTAGLGDTLLDSAGVRALADSFPGIRIEAVVHHRRKDIPQHIPLLAKLHYLRKGPHAFVSLWRELKAAGPWDAVLFFSCHDPEARCLGYLLARDATIGLSWRTELPWLCAINIDEPGLRKAHLAEQAARIAREAGAEPRVPRMVYEVAGKDRADLDAALASLGFPLAPGVVFQLGGGGAAYRDWPAENFAVLARMSHEAGIGPVFVLGGPDHKAKASEFARAAAGIPFFDLVDKLPLRLSAALLERARCVVSTDTGIMHLAFALGVPTVALLHCSPGPTRVGPTWEPGMHAVIALPKPVGYKSPADASMGDIPPEKVFSGLRDLYFRKA